MVNLYARNPILDQNRLYIIGDSLYCLNTSDGATIWSNALNSQTTPAVDDENVYCFGNGNLNAFNKNTGAITWQKPLSYSAVAALVVDSNYLYADHYSSIKAYDKSSGAEVWSYDIPDGGLSGLSAGAIALANNVLCLSVWSNSASKGMLYAIDATNGTHKWDYTFNGEGAFSPSIANEVVYVTEWKLNTLWGFNINTGDSVFMDNSQNYRGKPTIANHKLFVGDQSGGVQVLQSKVPSGSDYFEEKNALFSIFPNPASNIVKLKYYLHKESNVKISIFDNVGRKVKGIEKFYTNSGNYVIDYNTSHLSPGVYFVVLEVDSNVFYEKMIKK